MKQKGNNRLEGRIRRQGSKRMLVCLIVGLLLAVTWAQLALALDPKKAITQYLHEAWTAENGLPQNTVQAIIQTRDGYLWLGTQDGLVRFDGTHFTPFSNGNGDGIKQPHILCLYEDREGSVWIGTLGGGLNRFKDGKLTSYTTKDGLSSDTVGSIYEDAKGTLWIGTREGLNQFKDGKFSVYTTKDGLSNNIVRAIYQDQEGSLWIGTRGGGLNRFKDGKFTSYTTKDGLSDDYVWTIYEDQEGSLWIGTEGSGLNRFKDGKFTSYTTKDGLLSNQIRALWEDKKGNLWIGTLGGGLSRFRDGKLASYTAKDGLSDDSVMSIYEDKEGSLWLGTNASGLSRLKDGRFSAYTIKEGLSNNMVWTIYGGRDGSIWAGTQGGLNHLKDERVTAYTTQNGLSYDAIMAIYEDKEGNLWVGTNGGGLNRFRDGKFTVYTTKDGLSNNNVRSIYEDKEGNLWVGTNGGGLNRFKDGKFSVYTTKDGLSNNFVRSIYQDREGNLWIGTNGGGLNRFKGGKLSAYTTREGLSNDFVWTIYEDQEGSLWIGTEGGGLNRLKNGKITSFTTKDGLFNNIVFAILEDDHANLWMSCNKGIFRVSKQELNDFADGKLHSISSVVYETADGLRSNECNTGSPAGCRTRDGKLWFPTIKGVAVIDPNNIQINTLVPPVTIEQVIIDGKAVGPTEKIEMPPGRGELEFHFTALSFLAPEKVRFKYKLEGFDKDWTEAKTERKSHYTNIPPGRYRFRVMACNNDGIWNEAGATFDFYLKPHFYQTTWFYALCALAVALAGFGIYRFRVRQLRHRTLQLELIVGERTQELKRSQAQVLKLEKQATEQRMAGGFAHEMRNALAGSKLVLDQALALDGLDPNISLNLANCRALKEIYLELNETLPPDKMQAVLARMQKIFTNEERLGEILQLVRKATSRGLNITQRIMDYSEISQQQPGRQRINLHELTLKVVNEVTSEFSSQGILIQYELDPQLCVIGDEAHFYAVIKNILLNAQDALIDPGLAERTARLIQIKAASQEDRCLMTISDNGVGVAPENLQKIFEPFYSTKPASGTGLGLGVVKKILSLYQGEIEVRSEEGKGTSFSISLPAYWSEAVSEAA